jgi:hypothetical protein
MARKKAPKAPKQRKPEPARVAAQDSVLEEVQTGGLGIDEGIVITTTLILIFAIYLIWDASKMYAVA